MKFNIKAIATHSLFLLTFIGVTACGGDKQVSLPEALINEKIVSDNVSITEQETLTVSAKSLQQVSFNYTTKANVGTTKSATGTIDLPDQNSTVSGNLTLALDIVDLAGISQVTLDFSNGNSNILSLQVCGGAAQSCDITSQANNSEYRLFVNGINPLDYQWKTGANIINVWVDNKLGDRSIAATLNLNWQPIALSQINAQFSNIVVNQVTGKATGDLEITWDRLASHLFYNVFIASENGVNSQNFSTLADGQARLLLIDNKVVFTGLDANKEYFYTVSGVDDSGESAFAGHQSVIDLSRGAPIVSDDIVSLNQGETSIINVVENDTTSSGQLAIISFTQPTNGIVTDNGDGTLSYQHDGSAVTTDQFTYKVNNGTFDSATATVNITITLVNTPAPTPDPVVNEKPVLTATPLIQSIPENSAVDTPISTISAVDPEGDAQVWSISAGNGDGVFGIDNTGAVTVVDTTELNFELTTQYILTVKAEDAAAPLIFETIDITVNITDILENQQLIPDATFNTNGVKSFNTYSYAGDDSIVNTVRQADGKLVMIVNTTVSGGQSLDENISAIRLNTDGSVDSSYGDNGRRTFAFADSQVASKAIVDASDNIYIVGTDYGGVATAMVIKIDASGNLDTSFNIDGKVEFTNPDNTSGVDIYNHSNGYLYIATSGESSSIPYNVLKVFRIDVTGTIASLNSDSGFAEFELFTDHNFDVVGISEISTGELVVFGTDDDPVLVEGNFGIAVLNQSDLTQPSIVATSFDTKTIIDGSGTTAEFMKSYLSLTADSYIVAGESKYINGVSFSPEAAMLKINVTNTAITLDTGFASSGAFVADLDGDSTAPSSIESLVVDSANNISFVANSVDLNLGDATYLTGQVDSTGIITPGFNTQTILSNATFEQASDLIIDTTTNNLYVASNDASLSYNNVAFQQFLNDGSPVANSTQLLNFTSSNETLTGVNLLQSAANAGDIWISSEAPKDDFSGVAIQVSVLDSAGELDKSKTKNIGGGQMELSTYGPSLELSDGSIIYTIHGVEASELYVYKVSGGDFTSDAAFVPGIGFAAVQLPFTNGSFNEVTLDTVNNQIVISGTNMDASSAFVIKVNVTDGSLYTGGSFVNGFATINIASEITLSFDQVIPQTDGTLIGLGNIDNAGFSQPFLVKLTPNGALDTSFNTTGYKIFNLSLPNNVLVANGLRQLADSSYIFSVNNFTSSHSHLVKTDSSGVLDPLFASAGVLNISLGSNFTIINDMALDSDDNLYAVGTALNTTNDNLVLKVDTQSGVLSPTFNAYSTPGYWMFDEGGEEVIDRVLFDLLNDRLLLGSTVDSSVEYNDPVLGLSFVRDLRVSAFMLTQLDN
ncbi:Ig-like domain-containing protein [Colwellia echini]|nr:Ig-like domain-containing protein [Colwellia echini]